MGLIDEDKKMLSKSEDVILTCDYDVTCANSFEKAFE